MTEKKYVTINEASKMLGVTPLTLRNWDKAGKLVALRNPLNNYRIYKKEDLDFFLRRIESKGKVMMG
ncbi:MAG: MerR family DNA-binding transcriptional regulator [Patescibacteria group bacterium]